MVRYINRQKILSIIHSSIQARALAALLPLLLFFGCAGKEPILSSKTSHITIILKDLKYSDMGFLKQSKNALTLELYEFGNPVFRLEINKETICVDGNCLSKKTFVERYLGEHYYPQILEEILSKKPIFDAKNLTTTDTGFEQRILEKSKYDIIYKIEGENIYFVDKKSGVKVAVKSTATP